MNNRTQQRKHGGFTLLEILLTMAILLIGMTAVFQTTKSAFRRMAEARELTEAQNACQAVLNALLAQSAPIQPDLGRSVDNLPNWKIKIDLYPAPQNGLFVLHLSALQLSPTDGMLVGTKYQLLRWLPAERVQIDPFSNPSWAEEQIGIEAFY